MGDLLKIHSEQPSFFVQHLREAMTWRHRNRALAQLEENIIDASKSDFLFVVGDIERRGVLDAILRIPEPNNVYYEIQDTVHYYNELTVITSEGSIKKIPAIMNFYSLSEGK